jgi:glutamyl-tRNA reductase
VILSTCNRVEVYAVTRDLARSREGLLGFLSHFHGVPVAAFESHIYFHHGESAVRHLFGVVASLESIIIGEYQILGQVKDAYSRARVAGNTGTVLNKLLHFAIETGKRARSETRIGDGVLSISSAAVDLAKKALGDLSARRVLVIGAGETCELAARHLVSNGVTSLVFANRTFARAADLATRFGGDAVSLHERGAALLGCDLVVSATASPDFIIGLEEAEAAMAARNGRPLLIMDIAAPRDVDPDVAGIDGVSLYCIDDLDQIVTHNAHLRAAEIERVKEIIEEKCADFHEWYCSLRVIPTLVSLRRHFEMIRDEALESYDSDLKELPEIHRELVRRFAASLTRRFLSHPSRALKQIAMGSESETITKSIRAVFDLEAESCE